MKTSILTTVAAAALIASPAALIAAPAFGHHSFSAEFTDDVVDTIEGEVTEVLWRNPHVRYEVAVTDADGETVIWELQTNATTGLTRTGWYRDSIAVGDHIVVEGARARDNSPKLYINYVELDDGTVLAQRGERAQAAGPETYDVSEPFQAAEGRPIDITGVWSNSHNFRVTVDDLEPKPTPFTDEARAIYESRQFGDDPGLRCVPVGLPRTFGAPRGMQVFDAGAFYLMVHEGGDEHRWVWMDGREASDTQPLSFTGFSTGRWEGEELVIETTHLLPGWLDGSGLPMSGPETRTEERWSFSEDRSEIVRIMTIHDPLYTEPLVRTRGSLRADMVIQEESCDPDSFYDDLLEQGLIEDYFAREGR